MPNTTFTPYGANGPNREIDRARMRGYPGATKASPGASSSASVRPSRTCRARAMYQNGSCPVTKVRIRSNMKTRAPHPSSMGNHTGLRVAG